MTIWFASGNKHKQQELADILKGHTLKLPSEAGIKNFDPEETGGTFAENALIKAGTLHQLLWKIMPEQSFPVLADDSGLCVDALGGRPGIYSARYYGKNSWNPDGSFQDNSSEKLSSKEQHLLLLEELKAQQGADITRKCRFVCAMVLFFSPVRYYLVQETLEGEIVPSAKEIRGNGGFGYDPIVYIPELGRTTAELSTAEKNSLSHRGKAGRLLAKLLD